MKLRYNHQLVLSVVLVLFGNILGTVLKTWVYRSAAFVVCGLIWIINPVMLGNVPPTKEQIKWIRGAGVILILIGVFTRVGIW